MRFARFIACGQAALERQADAGFEIAAVISDPDIAAKVDDLVAELHHDSARKLAAEDRTVWRIDTTRGLRSTWTGAHGRLTGKRADLTDGAGGPSRHVLRISRARKDSPATSRQDPSDAFSTRFRIVPKKHAATWL